jgi:hypothetical protein
MTPKDSTGISPYALVYGKEAKMPLSLELNALTYAVNIEDTKDTPPLQKRLNQLLKSRRRESRSIKENMSEATKCQEVF